MTDHSETAWEQDEIESHLRSAMDALTPNVFDKIDLSTPQEIYVKPSRRVRMYRRMRTVAMAAAACLCVAVLGASPAWLPVETMPRTLRARSAIRETGRNRLPSSARRMASRRDSMRLMSSQLLKAGNAFPPMCRHR